MRAVICRKLRSRAGESFTEVLAAVLVASIAVALMAGMITSASTLSRNSAEADAKLYQGLTKAESGTPATVGGVAVEPGSMVVTVTPASGAAKTVTFDSVTFSGDGDLVCAYSWRRAAP